MSRFYWEVKLKWWKLQARYRNLFEYARFKYYYHFVKNGVVYVKAKGGERSASNLEEALSKAAPGGYIVMLHSGIWGRISKC